MQLTCSRFFLSSSPASPGQGNSIYVETSIEPGEYLQLQQMRGSRKLLRFDLDEGFFFYGHILAVSWKLQGLDKSFILLEIKALPFRADYL